jgi:hypothetical protein
MVRGNGESTKKTVKILIELKNRSKTPIVLHESGVDMDWFIAVGCYAATGVVGSALIELAIGWASQSLAKVLQFIGVLALLIQAYWSHGFAFAATVPMAAIIGSLIAVGLIAIFSQVSGSDTWPSLRRNR